MLACSHLVLTGAGVIRDCDDYLALLRWGHAETVHVVLRVVRLDVAVNDSRLAAAAARTRDR